MIRFLRRLISNASDERALRDTREEIADLEDKIASAHVRLDWLRERERRMQSRMLLGMAPDEIVRRSGAGA